MAAPLYKAAVQLPATRTVDGLYVWAQRTTDALNRLSNIAVSATSGANLTSIEQLVAELQVAIGDLQGSIGDSGTGLTDQQRFELSLVTRVDEVLGSVSAAFNDTLRRAEEQAEATINALLLGQRNRTEIRVEQTIRQTETLSLAQQITTISAGLGATNASIVVEQTARATGDAALASQVTTLTSSVASNVAQIAVVAETVDGVSSRFGVTLTSQGYVTGAIQLDGTDAQSTFTVLSGNFRVALTSDPGATPVQAFDVGTSNGVTTAVLRGDLLADGAITARTVAAGSITADKISVSSLSALNANLGTVTAGLIRNVADTIRDDLTNLRRYRVDGTFDIDAANRRIRIVSA